MPTELLYLGPPEHVASLRERLAGFEVRHAVTADEVDALLPRVEVVLDASMAIRFDAERLGRASALRLFTTATTGSSHIDHDALASRGVPLLTLAGQRDVLQRLTPAAELSWALVLACARRLPAAARHVLDGGWDRTAFPGTMLLGKTIGIIGLGRIGSWMARYAGAFGMERLGFDPVAEAPSGVTAVALDDLLARSDVVTVHVPLDASTAGLLDRRRIESMKSGAILVNTSRGEILDEAAVVDAVRRGHLGGVGVDVLAGEPDTARHPLVELARTDDRVVVTPHIGGYSPEAVAIVVGFTADRIREWCAA